MGGVRRFKELSAGSLRVSSYVGKRVRCRGIYEEKHSLSKRQPILFEIMEAVR